MTSVAWPAITTERLPWTPSSAAMSRTQRRAHTGPYDAALPAFIAKTRIALPAEIATELDEASNEIARFDAGSGQLITPFASILLRSESAASSQIEHLTASARAIAEAELVSDETAAIGRRRNADQVVANTRAMQAALDLAERLDASAILQMHRALMESVEPEIAGEWRTQQVWVGGSTAGPHHAMFVPPHHRHVIESIDDLVAFMQRDDIPALAQAAVAHAQFETIHPFPDGNGRTGRALVHAMLRAKHLTRSLTVPISAGLLVDIDGYFVSLDAYRTGDAEPIIRRFTDASFAAIDNGRQLADELTTIRQEWNETVKARRGSGTWKIADLLLRQPVVNAKLIARELGIAPNNVYAPLRPLIDAGVLKQSSDRQRNQVWRAAAVLSALDAFASRSGKRSRSM